MRLRRVEWTIRRWVYSKRGNASGRSEEEQVVRESHFQSFFSLFLTASAYEHADERTCDEIYNPLCDKGSTNSSSASSLALCRFAAGSSLHNTSEISIAMSTMMIHSSRCEVLVLRISINECWSWKA